MSRVLGSLVVSVLLANVALAQPGGYAPPPPPQPYPPQPQPQPYAPQPYAYQPPPVQLTAEEADMLQRGPISDGAHIGGGLVALFFGFGVGQAVQGRYGDTGWIFTVGEAGSMALLIYGATRIFHDCFDDLGAPCHNEASATPFVVGILGLTGFRIWEIVDAFAGPASYNRRYKDLQMRVNGYSRPQWGLYSARSMDREASVMGLELKF
jgi:hypothetical protein